MKHVLLVATLLCIASAAFAAGTNEQPAQTDTTGFNATGFPIVDDPITITVAGRKRNEYTGDTYNTLSLVQELTEMTNVSIDWDLTPASAWNERKNLIFASLDLPDAFFGIFTLGNADIVNYGSQGILVPLEEMIDTYGDNLANLFGRGMEYRNMITAPDGHIYSLSVINERLENAINDATFINATWLERLGIPMPTTLDELKAALIAIRDGDPNQNGDSTDEIPYSFRYPRNWSFPAGSFGIGENWQLTNVDENGNVFYIATTQNYRDYVNFMHDLYSEDLIDVEVFTQNNNVYRSKYGEGLVGMFTEWQTEGRLGPDLIGQYEPVPILDSGLGYEGTVTVWAQAQNSLGAFAITNVNEYPEATLRWIDTVYDPIVSFDLSYGREGEGYEIVAGDRMQLLDPPAGQSYAEYRHAISMGAGAAFAIQDSTFRRLVEDPVVAEKRQLYALYSQWLPAEFWHIGLAAVAETEELATMENDIQDYTREQTVRWITEGGIDREWESFQARLDAMGLSRMMEIRQGQYDRLMGR